MAIIRQFQPTDMFSVISIASKTLTEQYTPNLFTYFYETTPDLFLVAEHHKKIIGFTIAIRITSHHGRILMMSVLPAYQRQHVGSDLLTTLLASLQKKNITQISLEVRTDNHQAISFYTNHQFSIIDTLSKFYQNGEDAFMMKRVLPPG